MSKNLSRSEAFNLFYKTTELPVSGGLADTIKTSVQIHLEDSSQKVSVEYIVLKEIFFLRGMSYAFFGQQLLTNQEKNDYDKIIVKTEKGELEEFFFCLTSPNDKPKDNFENNFEIKYPASSRSEAFSFLINMTLKKNPPYLILGGDGNTTENAIQILFKDDLEKQRIEDNIVRKILVLRGLSYDLVEQKIMKEDGNTYDKIVIKTENGEIEEYYFCFLREIPRAKSEDREIEVPALLRNMIKDERKEENKTKDVPVKTANDINHTEKKTEIEKIDDFINKKANKIANLIFDKYGKSPVATNGFWDSFFDRITGGNISLLRVEAEIYERSLHEANIFFLNHSDAKFDNEIIETLKSDVKIRLKHPKEIKKIKNTEELLAHLIKRCVIDFLINKGLIIL